MSGCFPAGDSQSDDKKELNFITGKNLVIQMDYQGAIDAFEKSLEVNPRSAAAHFELGWLYEGKVTPPDAAAAIYHYERFLKYSAIPDKAEADLARQHINNCKLELAKTVSALGPLPSPALREMERVVLENKDLEAKLAALQSQLDEARVVASVRAQNMAVSPPSVPAPVSNPPRAIVDLPRNEPPPVTSRSSIVSNTRRPATVTATRTHTVKSGETMAAIARKYGVSIAGLQAANPQVRPTHLLVGQTLNVPPS